jgi:spermidine/putrescine transport system substrate-binding protein
MPGKRLTWIILGSLAVLVVVVLVARGLRTTGSDGRRQLNLLLWTGYEEPAILNAFKQKYSVDVSYKTFVGGDAMFSLLTQSKGQYDVVVVDPEYIQKLHALGRLAELNPSDYDFSDYFESFKKFPLSWIDGKLYAVVVEYGALGLVYNTNHISLDEVRTYDILFSPKVKGKVGVWDWYLPIMGVLSRSLGYNKPYEISDEQFAALKRRLLRLRPQLAAIHANFPELMSSLANEDTWIVPGGAGWVASALQQQGKPYDWTVPKEGGVMWMDSLVIPNDAPHPEVAKLYIQWMMTAEAQALLSQKQAFHSNVPNRKAYDLLPKEHKDRLKTHNEEDVRALLAKLAVRSLPVNQDEKVWQEAWEEFKAGRIAVR